jgi:hypothetical protein
VEVDRIIDCRDRTTEVPLTDAEMDALEEEEKQVQEEEEEEEEEEGQKGIDNNNSSSSSAAAASATAGLEEGGEEGLEMEDDLAFLEKEAASGSGSSGSSGIGSGGKGLSLGGGKGARACEYKGFHFCRPSPPPLALQYTFTRHFTFSISVRACVYLFGAIPYGHTVRQNLNSNES